MPALEIDGELHTEVAALVQYLAEQAPQSKLLPAAGTMERFRVNQWLAFISSELHKTFSPWLWRAETAASTKQVARDKLAARFAELDALFCDAVVPDRRHIHRCGRLCLHDHQLVEFSQDRSHAVSESFDLHGTRRRAAEGARSGRGRTAHRCGCMRLLTLIGRELSVAGLPGGQARYRWASFPLAAALIDSFSVPRSF